MKPLTRVRTAINFTKYSVLLLRCLPPARTSTKLHKIIFELSWWFMFLSSLGLLFPLMAAVYYYRDNAEIMTKSICLSCAVSQCTIKTLFCRIRRTRLQKLFKEMENFIQNCNDQDLIILNKYVSKCTALHVGVVVWAYLTSISFIVGPFVIPQPFPTDAVYPFSLNNTYIKIIIYAHQSLVGLQTSAAVLLDCLVAVILWFVCARFELFCMTIRNSTGFNELRDNLRKYQSLLRYTYDMKYTINLFVFATTLTSVGGMLFSAIQLVADQPIAIKAQYGVVAVTASIGLFVCCWAADSLVQVEYLVGVCAFQSKWYEMNQKYKICILHLISQSQHPITMKVQSILPTLSLQFFSQFLMFSFKFFASLRILIG